MRKQTMRMKNLTEASRRLDETAQSLKSGSSGPKSLSRALTPRSKRVAVEYEKIKDQEDETLTPYQRNLKVNRFMVELAVKQNVLSLTKPI